MKTSIENQRQIFIFIQFSGNNKSMCNQICPYCYGGKKENKSYWNGNAAAWELALIRLDAMHGGAGVYGVFSYGESMMMPGFYEMVEVFGRHPSWTLAMVTNLSYDPTRLVNTRLVKEGRLMLHPCWHPFGMVDCVKGWENFKSNLLIMQAAKVPLHVLYLWWKPQIKLFPQYFEWLDAHNIRVNVRRYVGKVGGLKIPFTNIVVGGKDYPKDLTKEERGFIYANTCPKVTKYGLDLVKPTGKICTAGMDMILVKPNGDVALCADMENGPCLGNIFDLDFRLNTQPQACLSGICGGDYGMLHLIDEEFGPNIGRLPNQPFLSIAENLIDTNYPKRAEMLSCLKKIAK